MFLGMQQLLDGRFVSHVGEAFQLVRASRQSRRGAKGVVATRCLAFAWRGPSLLWFAVCETRGTVGTLYCGMGICSSRVAGINAAWTDVARATGGIIASMRRFHAYFLVVVHCPALLVLSSVGPLLDHHYVERDPTHTHLGAARPHVHDYTAPDAHDHARPLTPDAPSGVGGAAGPRRGLRGRHERCDGPRRRESVRVFRAILPFQPADSAHGAAALRSDAHRPTSRRGCSPSPCPGDARAGPRKEGLQSLSCGSTLRKESNLASPRSGGRSDLRRKGRFPIPLLRAP